MSLPVPVAAILYIVIMVHVPLSIWSSTKTSKWWKFGYDNIKNKNYGNNYNNNNNTNRILSLQLFMMMMTERRENEKLYVI